MNRKNYKKKIDRITFYRPTLIVSLQSLKGENAGKIRKAFIVIKQLERIENKKQLKVSVVPRALDGENKYTQIFFLSDINYFMYKVRRGTDYRESGKRKLKKKSKKKINQ